MANSTPKKSEKIDKYILNVKKSFSGFTDEKSCCSKKCWKDISNEEFERHLQDVAYFRGNGYQNWWSWVKTLYYISVPKCATNPEKTIPRKRVRQFKLPAISINVCKTMFCDLLGMVPKTMGMHINSKEPRQAFTIKHGNTGRLPFNSLKLVQVETVVDWMLNIAYKDGSKSPCGVSNEKETNSEHTNVLVQYTLPKSYTINKLFIRYRNEMQEQNPLGRSSFYNILKEDKRLAHIKITSILTKRKRK